MQNATDMLADKVAYEDALREFDSNYRQTHQGVSARDAEEAYGQFHKEQHEKLQQKWGGNPFLMEGVNRMAESIRQPSMQRAVAYRDSEEDAYKKSVLESSRAQALQLFADPSRSWQEKEAALQAEENNLRLFAGQQWDGKSGQWTGGTDITADIMAFREKAARADIEGRLAVGDIEGAKLLVNRYGGGAMGGTGSTSERNLAANNFGNVKNTSGSYNAYATRHDGLMGVGERVLRYSNTPERGWHATTLRQMVDIYAPASDGNDPAGYAAWLGKHLGVGPDEKVNLRDPKILAGLIRHMPVMEHGAKRVSVSEEEAMRAAQALLTGQRPNITGKAAASGGGVLPPEQVAKFRQALAVADADNRARGYMARIEAGEDETDVQKEVLALPHEERAAINRQFHAYLTVYNRQQQEKTWDGIAEWREKMANMPLGEAYRAVNSLPEGSKAERQIKKQAKADYAYMAQHGGLHRTTDPDAYTALLDKISYGEISGGDAVKVLRADPLAVKVAQADLKKLEADLKDASDMPEKELAAAYRWAIGGENGPKATELTNVEKKQLMAFSRWARHMVKTTNRGKDPNYAQELARQFVLGGEAKGKWYHPGYGKDKIFGEALNDASWLPDLTGEQKKSVDEKFDKDPDFAGRWAARYGGDVELGKRAYYKGLLLQGIGKRKREDAQ